MAAKMAGRYEGVRTNLWRTFVLDKERQPRKQLHRDGYRRSGTVSNIKNWSVGGKRNLVVLHFDDLTVDMHYSDAFKLYVWIRESARDAKAWAGDGSRNMTTRAVLVDAEVNDKFVYAL